MSLPGDPVLVRLHSKEGARELDGDKMFVYPVAGNSNDAGNTEPERIPIYRRAARRPFERNELKTGTCRAAAYAFVTSPLQPGWPHRQTTSTRSPMPSQWALQYFDPSVRTQLQAGFAHFFAFAINPPP
jgi:hypothetical protein